MKGAPVVIDLNKGVAGQLKPGTISNLFDRKELKNADGSYSTTSSMSIGTDEGEVLIPTVVDGKRLSKDEAVARYHKTGEHLGVFDSPQSADAYAQSLHEKQAATRGSPYIEPSGY